MLPQNQKLKISILFFLFFVLSFFSPPSGFGQSSDGLDIDILAPSIRHDPLSDPAISGKDLTITATITDNLAVFEAAIFYRHTGTETYSRIPMHQGKNNIYSAVIPKEMVVLPAVEYYIQAEDRTGNIVSRGFAISPLTVLVRKPIPDFTVKEDLIPPSPAPTFPVDIIDAGKPVTSPLTPVIDKPLYKKWWVWAIAAVVVGAAAGGGGGGGSPTSSTGSVTVSGPTP